jgi:hypothetical protein
MPKADGYFRAGEAHLNAKLTDAKVRHIRRSSAALDELARRFSVGKSAIHRARIGETWAHLPNAKTVRAR